MVALRATKKMLRYLPPAEAVSARSDGALGDWYANRLIVDRRPLVLLVSSESLLAILIPGRELRTIPERLPAIVGARLRRLGVHSGIIRAELATMAPIKIAVTMDRSVLGSLVDFAKAVPRYLPIEGWDDRSLPLVEVRLGDTPCRVTGRMDDTLWPARCAQRLLSERWPMHSA